MKQKLVKTVLASAMILVSSPLWAETTQVATQPSQVVENEQKKSGIELANFDQSVSLKDDFYQHVNGKWIEKTKIPAGMPLIDGFYELDVKKDEQLHEIIDEISIKKITLNKAEQQIADLYHSFLDEKLLNKLGISPIKKDLDRISQLKNKKILVNCLRNSH